MSEPARVHTPEGSDALAVELRRLSDRIDTLQADVRRVTAPSLPTGPAWDEDDRTPDVSHAWLERIDPVVRQRPQAPRLLLEGLFLAACAAGAALADLDPVAILAVMVGAWVLVALIEWAASRAERRRDELLSMPPPAPAAPVEVDDPAWFVPPVERTMLDGADVGEVTAATKLPRIEPGHDPDVTVEQRPD